MRHLFFFFFFWNGVCCTCACTSSFGPFCLACPLNFSLQSSVVVADWPISFFSLLDPRWKGRRHFPFRRVSIQTRNYFARSPERKLAPLCIMAEQWVRRVYIYLRTYHGAEASVRVWCWAIQMHETISQLMGGTYNKPLICVKVYLRCLGNVR